MIKVIYSALIPLFAIWGWLDPVHSLNRRAITLYNLQKYEESAETMRVIEPDRARSYIIYYNLGCTLYKSGKYTEAMAEFFRAVRSSDDTLKAAAYYNLGSCEYRHGDYERALLYLGKAIRHNPDDEEARINYEFVLERLNLGLDKGIEPKYNHVKAIQNNITASPPIRQLMGEKECEVIYEMLDARERAIRRTLFFMKDTSYRNRTD